MAKEPASWKSLSRILSCTPVVRRPHRIQLKGADLPVTKPSVELLLGRHTVYRLFRKLTGSDNLNREFVQQYVRPENGDEILDIGCGPADVFEFMPQVRYTGI